MLCGLEAVLWRLGRSSTGCAAQKRSMTRRGRGLPGGDTSCIIPCSLFMMLYAGRDGKLSLVPRFQLAAVGSRGRSFFSTRSCMYRNAITRIPQTPHKSLSDPILRALFLPLWIRQTQSGFHCAILSVTIADAPGNGSV